ncbi:unnamed protein product [Protopolystoma xenopodis]|uniref:Uncharacterized protein n=1 Tax=Protopolystoma xenopodis TaxID=117903 RepID=A0A448XH64_9PLAT|nr:unnamed protein product [Protopolystoma xenopodis]
MLDCVTAERGETSSFHCRYYDSMRSRRDAENLCCGTFLDITQPCRFRVSEVCDLSEVGRVMGSEAAEVCTDRTSFESGLCCYGLSQLTFRRKMNLKLSCREQSLISAQVTELDNHFLTATSVTGCVYHLAPRRGASDPATNCHGQICVQRLGRQVLSGQHPSAVMPKLAEHQTSPVDIYHRHEYETRSAVVLEPVLVSAKHSADRQPYGSN